MSVHRVQRIHLIPGPYPWTQQTARYTRPGDWLEWSVVVRDLVEIEIYRSPDGLFYIPSATYEEIDWDPS